MLHAARQQQEVAMLETKLPETPATAVSFDEATVGMGLNICTYITDILDAAQCCLKGGLTVDEHRGSMAELSPSGEPP